MATPVSGAISFADIQTAFGFGYDMGNYQYSRWYQPASLIYGNFSATQISFSDFYNKQANDPAGNGSVTYSSASTNSFTVPLYRNTLTVEIWGAGGGGGGYVYDNLYGATGGTSSVTFSNSLTASANGGTGGQDAFKDRNGGLVYGSNGVGGTASGNVLSTTGNAGYSLGVGAGAPSGGGDVAPGYRQAPAPNGSAPGGGGAGFYYDTTGKFPAVAGGAGSGGRAKSTWASAALPAGTTATVIVGGGGAPGNGYGGYGADGKITISWS